MLSLLKRFFKREGVAMKKKKKKKARRPVKRKKKPAKKTKKRRVVKKAKKKSIKRKKSTKAKKKVARKTVLPPGASLEEIGVVTHYFSHVEAAVIKMTRGSLSQGDTIVIKGHTTDFKEKINSMQLDHAPISNAVAGQEIGLKVKAKVREHDTVYKLIV